jgi:hypothetical protein
MKKLTVDLENCYGIKRLVTEFDFSTRRTFAIYAPNGAMKSSFAEAFKDVADGKQSRDRVFPARECTRRITDDTGAPLSAKAVMVIRNYEEVFGCNEETATLLVDQGLRSDYEQLHADLKKGSSAESVGKNLPSRTGRVEAGPRAPALAGSWRLSATHPGLGKGSFALVLPPAS